MRKYFVTIALVIALLLTSLGVLTSCQEEVVTPGASAIFDRLHLRGSLFVWDGSKYVAVRLPTTADTIVGRATTDTLTNKTLTSPTITGATLTTATLTSPAFSGTGTGTWTLTHFVSTNATLTAPTISGTTTIDDFVADNVSITGGAISGATISVASPTITGTPVVANRASGNCTLASGTKVVTHGFASTPTVVLVTPVGNMGTTAGTYLYTSSVGSSNFTVTCSGNSSATNVVYWLAILANE